MRDLTLKKSSSFQRKAAFMSQQKPYEHSDVLKKNGSVLMLTTFPPRECGIATYSEDLKKSVEGVFSSGCALEICALYNEKHPLKGADHFNFSLNTDNPESYQSLAAQINSESAIKLVYIQHEFGLYNGCSDVLIAFLEAIKKPILVAFHTVIPNPAPEFKTHVSAISSAATALTVMTATSKQILIDNYDIQPSKIEVISHGTHLIRHKNKSKLKSKYGLQGKTVLSTFGLLGPGKSIETTLEALPEIVADFPNVRFLVLGKTHPTLIKNEGEVYREFLEDKIRQLNLSKQVIFVNEFLPLGTLLEYLQLTDIYLFTSKDPNQAVSGTFSYAMSCGCPILSTPIPHAKEFLSENKGLLFDFENSAMLAKHLRTLLNDKQYRKNLGLNGLHASASTSWQNSALSHGQLFKTYAKDLTLGYKKPDLKLDHLFRMTTDTGIIQFAQLNQPDLESGYTLDDNARALIVMCEQYKLTQDEALLPPLFNYLSFIINCQRYNGRFYNYVNINAEFTAQNDTVNLEDSNGRGIWALGHLLQIADLIPPSYAYIINRAKECLDEFLPNARRFNSPRAMAFIIKGLAASNLATTDTVYAETVYELGVKLIKMYKHESRKNWKWFEPYLTYGNSVLPEAIFEIYKLTEIEEFKIVAYESFNFLLEHLFINGEFRVISNQTWFLRGDSLKNASYGGQQPIDVAYTILALKNFHQIFSNEGYEEKMDLAFSWFLGNNHLKRIIYNPCTTGCFDGLELNNVNLNQGAESTISYLMARQAFENTP